MPLNAAGWTTEEEEKLIKLVQPHTHLYYWLDPSRKNILTRERTWQEIAKELFKPGKCVGSDCVLVSFVLHNAAAENKDILTPEGNVLFCLEIILNIK